MGSYHDRPQVIARLIEAQRAKSYVKGSSKRSLKWDEEDLVYIDAAAYKLRRAKLFTHDIMKALDDFFDAYNYCALEIDKLIPQIESENPGMTISYDLERSKFVLVSKETPKETA